MPWNRLLYFVIAAYALPVVGLSLYASMLFTPVRSFGVFTTGVFLAVVGSISILLCLRRQEAVEEPREHHDVQELSYEKIDKDVANVSHTEDQRANIEEFRQRIAILSQQNDISQQSIAELLKLKDGLEKKAEEQERDYLYFQERVNEQQEQNRSLLYEHQQTINEQRDMLEKKQLQIVQLEGQVRDLHYEIKTLMDVEERQSIIRFPLDRFAKNELGEIAPLIEREEDIPPSLSSIQTPEEASQQLRRCLDIAQKITGGQYMHNRPSRLKDLPVESTALEMRRLFDNLRSENQATILLYSPRENKLLFVNNPIKSLLGWPPEKFVHQFQELLSDGGESWKQSISQLAFKNEAQASLWIIARSGQRVSLNCHLGLIPTGCFRHFVLGVLYQTR